MNWQTIIGLAGILGSTVVVSGADAGGWTTAEKDGRIEARRGETLLMAWQKEPLAKPAGGPKFAASAFIHPLCSPKGFVCTTIQAPDHLHHFGLWWPWKFIDVEGKRYNTWEIQEGQGAWVARSAKPKSGVAGGVAWELSNEVVVKVGDQLKPVIAETATVALTNRGSEANVLDITLRQKVLGPAVTIVDYRYSGFSWRGPMSWNKTNSQMLTSEGDQRDTANGRPARWVVVNGAAPTGPVAVLLMSAAAEVAGTAECLRVWDSKMYDGQPFVNFNPVMQKALPLDQAHPAVANRKYRLVIADHPIDAAAAEAEWRKWLGKGAAK